MVWRRGFHFLPSMPQTHHYFLILQKPDEGGDDFGYEAEAGLGNV